MTATTQAQTDAAIGRLNNALVIYATYAKGSVDWILAKKGNDLRIQLYTGFRQYMYKGDDIADTEMRSRSARGIGTRVRDWTLNHRGAPPAGLNKRQALVWREIQVRQHGVGILAVSWLLRRWRWRKAVSGWERYLVNNKTGENPIGSVTSTTDSAQFGTLARIEQRPGSIRLTGMTPGMADVAERYGIVSEAMDRVTGDMMPYIQRKMDAEARQLFPATL